MANGKTIRALVNKLPENVFDYICDSELESFLNMETYKVKYVHWYDYDEYDINRVCNYYGYITLDEMREHLLVVEFLQGILVIE